MTSLNALVSYGDSDEEGSDQEQPVAKPQQAPKRTFLSEADTFGSSLPKSGPSILPSFKPDSSGKVKIFAPKVVEDEGGDGIPSKKPTPAEDSGESKARCTLFSVLPPPRFHSSMIPPSVAGRRRAIATEDVEWGAKSRPVAAAQAIATKQPVPTPPVSKPVVENDSSDEEVEGKSFFSIGETSSIKAVHAAIFDYGTEIGPMALKPTPQTGGQSNEFAGIFGPAKPASTSFKQVRIDVVEGHEHGHECDHDHDEDEDFDADEDEEPSETGYREWLAAQQAKESGSASSSSSIDMAELRKMQGRHNKGETVNIIECKADDLLDPAEYARQKALEEAKASITGPNTMNAPRGRAKSRHQITYLAWLAKERETELKEFWSQSKMNKSQARLKYGF